MKRLAAIALLLLAGTASAAPLPGADSIYVRSIFPHQTVEKYLEKLRPAFALLDADEDGTVTQGDTEKLSARARTARRASLLGEMMMKDKDGDGVVTVAELREHYQAQRQQWSRRSRARMDEKFLSSFEKRLQTELAADLNRDGRITLQEIYAHADQQMRSLPTPLAYRMTIFDPAERSARGLRWDSVRATASAYFASLDADKNGILSQEEAYKVAPRNNASPPLYPRATGVRKPGAAPVRRAPQAVRDLCELPLPSAKAQIALLSAYEAQALSSVAIGSQDVSVGAATIDVAPGNTPLYVVITSFEPVIWRFTGATGRVEHAVITSTQPPRGPARGEEPGASGATGLPTSRVTFPPQGSCIRHFRQVPSTSAARASGVVSDILGRGVDIQSYSYGVSVFRLPSGAAETIKRSHVNIPRGVTTVMLEGGPVSLSHEGELASDVRMFHPGGVIALNPADIVASRKTARYVVLPDQAGLQQLVQQGALVYRNREFHIRRKIRFPAGLHGSHSATFLLLKGVPRPDGDPGHSCVVSEETGQHLWPSPHCR